MPYRLGRAASPSKTLDIGLKLSAPLRKGRYKETPMKARAKFYVVASKRRGELLVCGTLILFRVCLAVRGKIPSYGCFTLAIVSPIIAI